MRRGGVFSDRDPRRLPAALLLGCLVTLGCRGPGTARADGEDPTESGRGIDPAPAGAAEPGYFEARLDDLLEVLSVRVGVGPGLGVHAAVTRPIQIGAMALGSSASFEDQASMGTIYAGNTGTSVGVWDVRSLEYGFSVWYRYEENVLPTSVSTARWQGDLEERSPTAIEAGLHAGLAGVQASFDPVALVDFVIGVLGFGEGGWF
jgi:hypothetical protein